MDGAVPSEPTSSHANALPLSLSATLLGTKHVMEKLIDICFLAQLCIDFKP